MIALLIHRRFLFFSFPVGVLKLALMASQTILAIFTFLIVNLVYSQESLPRNRLIELNEENWEQMLRGEWMVEFFAPWCPACKGLEVVWKEFAAWSKDLDISVAQVDVTTNPGLSGRFMVTALPTIYHVMDGHFRLYRGSRDKENFISFVEDKKWQSVEEISSWTSPNSILMSLISYFFKLSMVLRSIHTKLIEEYGIPYWGSYLIFALVTILIGAILGLILVCIIDFVFPPKMTTPPSPRSDISVPSTEGDLISEVGDIKKKEEKNVELNDEKSEEVVENIDNNEITGDMTSAGSDEVRKRRPLINRLDNMDRIKKDPRFAHVLQDPRFRRIPKEEKKVKIDKRFKAMLDDNDDDFKLKYKIDKRGRPINRTSKEDLKKFYHLSSSECSESSGSESDDEKDLARGEGNVESCDGSTTESEDEHDEEVEHAWGELDTDATETSEITRRLAVCNMDWDRIKASDIYVLCNSFKPSEGIIENVKIYPSEYGKSRMKEEDLSGPKELVEEKIEIIENDENNDVEAEDDIEGSAYHMEKLRKYQLNRLRYYYAVVECDTPSTANKIYEECTGIEYESSAVRLDLRFIPDSMTFDDVPTSSADSMPEPDTYKPSIFTTTALQQAKVQLTWDETDPDRIRMTQKAFDKKNIEKIDLRAYLASSSSENEDENRSVKSDNDDDDDDIQKDSVAKYRALLLSIEEKEEKEKNEREDVKMEITWTPGLKEATQEIVKKKQSDVNELTPWDQYLKKKKEKRSRKREIKKGVGKDGDYSDDELPDDINLKDDFFSQDLGPEFEKSSSSCKLKRDRKSGKKYRGSTTSLEVDDSKTAELDLLLMENEDGKQHFNMKSLVKKGKKRGKTVLSDESDNFKFNVNDERFSEIFTSHLYNIDPSDPQFKMTEAMDMIFKEKEKRRNKNQTGNSNNKRFKHDEEEKEKEKPSKHAELKSLVKSIKNRTQLHQLNKKRK
uniref:Thioredoxin domain-containing protein n=1 Tax=Strigamia maritima TaxID=126957 RepID=T1J9K3_STRMM